MANQRLYQFLFSKVPMLTYANCAITIGSSGAVASSTGPMFTAITQPSGAVGQYLLSLNDNFAAFIQMTQSIQDPLNATPTLIASLTPGVAYSISTVGSATAAQWVTAGVPAPVTPAVGVVFTCAATSAGATSACKSIDSSLISNIRVMGTNTATSAAGKKTMQILIQCEGYDSTATPALIPANPASGSVLQLGFFLRNSSVSY